MVGMHKTFVIGDVHGCIHELQELLQQLAPSADDRLVFIGDLIDRGPDSIGVVREVVRLSTCFDVQLVLGNHEEKFLRYVHHINSGSGKEKEMKGVDEFPTLLSGLNNSELFFLQNACYTLHLPECDTLLVHGGVCGNAGINMPASYRYSASIDSDLKRNLGLFNKTRFLNTQGKFVALGDEGPDDSFWAEVYDGRWGHIFFGHQPFIQPEPKRFQFATGIDTGCVYGGWLSAIEIGSDGVRHSCIPARKVYSIKK
jgi:serine/threonine protein phosphatase 1